VWAKNIVSAAERRKSLATAEGRGSSCGAYEPRQGRKNLSPRCGSCMRIPLPTALLAASRYRARASRSRG